MRLNFIIIPNFLRNWLWPQKSTVLVLTSASKPAQA